MGTVERQTTKAAMFSPELQDTVSVKPKYPHILQIFLLGVLLGPQIALTNSTVSYWTADIQITGVAVERANILENRGRSFQVNLGGGKQHPISETKRVKLSIGDDGILRFDTFNGCIGALFSANRAQTDLLQGTPLVIDYAYTNAPQRCSFTPGESDVQMELSLQRRDGDQIQLSVKKRWTFQQGKGGTAEASGTALLRPVYNQVGTQAAGNRAMPPAMSSGVLIDPDVSPGAQVPATVKRLRVTLNQIDDIGLVIVHPPDGKAKFVERAEWNIRNKPEFGISLHHDRET